MFNKAHALCNRSASSLDNKTKPDPFKQQLKRGVSYRVLEQRVVFDGAAVDAAADVAASEPVIVDEVGQVSEQQASETLIAALADRSGGETSRSIVFIDSGVTNKDGLAQHIPDDAEVILIDGNRDGLLQIANALEGRRNLEAIHILSHGNDGNIILAGQGITEDTLNENTALLETIGNSLSADGDILLYGCRVAETDHGDAFLQKFADLSGADVAGSDDVTGHAKYGGDWQLESETGTIEAAALSAPDWDGKLEPLSISATGDPSVVFPATIAVGNSTVWTNAGFVGSTAIDLRATVVSADAGVAVAAFSSGNDPSIVLDTGGIGIGGSAAGSATIRWELFEAGTGQTVFAVGAPNFTVSDIDGTGAPNTIETIAPSLNGLQSYEVGTSTALSISTSGGLLTASGTDDDSIVAGGAARPSAAITFSWSDRSSWDITYTAERSLDGRVFSHDGDGEFVFASSVTTSLLSLDLDDNNSTALGTSYSDSFTEGGAAVPVVDADIKVVQHAALGTNLGSASVTLTNAQAGDVLSVGMLPAGITAMINTSVSGEITVTLSGDATVAAYETALKAISFENTSNDPNTADRQIQVAVTNTTFGTSSLAALSTISVLSVNEAPSGSDATIDVDEDTSHNFSATDFGFSDVDGDTLTTVIITTLPASSDGVLSLNGTPVEAGDEIPAAQITNLVFAPAGNINGNGLGSFTFQVKDNGTIANGGEDTDQTPNTIQFNIADVNDAPTADNETETIDEDTPVTINVLDGDNDVDGTIDPASVGIENPTNPGTYVTTLTEAGVGTWAVDTNPLSPTHGQITFTPVLHYNGPVTPITYQITDDDGATTTASVDVSIDAVNDAPIANPESFSTEEDVSIFGVVLTNDSDVDGHGLTVSAATVDLDGNGLQDNLTIGLGTLVPITNAAGDPIGQFSIETDGSFVFAPAANYNGPVPPVTYTVNDGNGGTATAALTITITPTPDAANDPFQILEDAGATNVNPIANDDTGAGIDGVADITITTAPTAAQGTLTYQVAGTGAVTTVADGTALSAAEAATLSFTPTPNSSGLVTLPYTLTDLNDNASNAEIAITVVATPDVVDDNRTTDEDTPVPLNPLTNDDDGTGVASVEITTIPTTTQGLVTYTNGLGETKTITTPGVVLTAAEAASLVFTPTANFNGTVNPISYTLTDTNGETDSAIINVTVTSINDAPDGSDKTITTDEDTAFTFSTTDFGFSDPADNDGFESVFINTLPAAGTLALNGIDLMPGQEIDVSAIPQLTYTPPANANGIALTTFTFSVKDDGDILNGGADTDPVANTIFIDVQSVDDPASINGGTGVTITGSTVEESDLSNGSNPSGTGEGASGTFTLTAVDGIDTLTVAGTAITVADLTASGATPVGPISTSAGAISITGYTPATGEVSYSYQLSTAVDHTVTTSDDITILLTDSDGSTATATLTLAIADDIVTANPDTDSVTEDDIGDDATASGNVVTGSGGLDSNTSDGTADVLGADGAGPGGPVTGVVAGAGIPAAVNVGGPLQGNHGALILNADGSYIYSPDSNIELSAGETVTDTFTYEVTDNDGDTATTTLSVLITGADDDVSLNGTTGTGLTIPGPTVSEAGLGSGTSPGVSPTIGTGSFTISAPDGLDTLRVGGTAIPRATLEALATTPIPPIATPSGTLTVTGYTPPTGEVTYSYTLTSPIDHQSASSDDIAIVVTDEDGSSSDGKLIITITDDAPIAQDDEDRVGEDSLGVDAVASGNVFTGSGGTDTNVSDGVADTLGADFAVSAGPVTAVVAGTGAPAGLGGIGASVAGAFGTLTLNGDGSYSYAPDGSNSAVDELSTGDTLTDVFTYEVTDNDGTAATATLTISIDGNNDAPVADADTGVVDEDGTLNIPVANGDDDVDGTLDLTSILIADPANPGSFVSELIVTGQGVWKANPTSGVISFSPEPNYNGPVDPITYRIADNEGATATATVTVTINPIPDPVDDLVSTDEDTPVQFNPLANDPTDDDAATVTIPTLPQVEQGVLTYVPTSGPFAGVVTPVTAGVALSTGEATTLVFNPASNFNGAVEPMTYVVTDSSGDASTATINISVTDVNDSPVANDDTYTASEDTPLSIDQTLGVIDSNDSDVDTTTTTPADTLSVALVNGASFVSGAPISLSSGAILTINDDGAFSYDANGAFEHLDSGETALDTFTYTLSDGRGGTDTASVTVTIAGANDAPVIVNPSVPQPDPGNPVPAGDPSSVIPVQNITDGQDFTTTPLIDVSDFALDPDVENLNFTTPSPLPQGLTLNHDGTVTGVVDPSASQGGDDPTNAPGLYTITVIVSDGEASATVTLTLDVSNLAPIAQNDSATLDEDAAPATGNVITDATTGDRDTAPDSDLLVIADANQGGNAVTLGSPFTVTGGGELTLNNDGSYSFDPGTAYNGLDIGETATETITYRVTDNEGGSDTATLTFTITGTNDAPQVIDPNNPANDPTDPAYNPNQPVGPADPNDIIPTQGVIDSSPITPLDTSRYFVDVDGEALAFVLDPATTPHWLTIDASSGIITGTPPHDASIGGPAGDGVYPITIQATDPDGLSVTTVATFDVTNLAPVANADTALTEADRAVTISVLDNDTDPDGDPLTVSVANAVNGTVTRNPDGTLTYKPNPGFSGTDTITYTIDDGNGGSATATVSVTVQAVHVPTPPPLSIPSNVDQAPQGTTGLGVHGIVLDTVKSVDQGTWKSTSLSTTGIVVSAVNGADSLGGLAAIDTINGVTGSGLTNSQAWDVLERLFGRQAKEHFRPEGLTGFVLRMDLAFNQSGDASQTQLVIESMISNDAMILNFSSKVSDQFTKGSEYTILMSDGSPLPTWLNKIGNDVLIGRPPVDADLLSLRVKITNPDGSFETKEIDIELQSGEVKPETAKQQGALPLPFDRQFATDNRLNATNHDALAAFLINVESDAA